MSEITFYVGDERPNLSGVITFTGSPTLAGATVTISAKTAEATAGISAQSATITIDDTEKTIDWSYSGAEFNIVGLYYPYLQVTFSGGDVLTVPTADTIRVKQPYGP